MYTNKTKYIVNQYLNLLLLDIKTDDAKIIICEKTIKLLRTNHICPNDFQYKKGEYWVYITNKLLEDKFVFNIDKKSYLCFEQQYIRYDKLMKILKKK
jgi:hypothetical protein